MLATLLVPLVLLATPPQATGEAAQARRWTLFPEELLYPAYVADPHRPAFALTLTNVRESDIGAATDTRYGLRMGARFGILELSRPGEEVGGLQLMGEVGMVAQFDRGNSSDNLGWDGLYGFHLVWRAREDLAVRAGVAHDSSHLGDEFIENTGRSRIEYTREELLAGLAYAPDGPWSGYVEYGHGFALRNDDLMEEGRVQLGLQTELRGLSERTPPYAALDVSAYEEDDWEENLTLQLGVLRRSSEGDSTWRVGLEYHDGRSPIGEFFRERERYVALGIWLDP